MDHEIPLRGHVTEAVTGNPIEADIDIQGITYTQGEIRKSEPSFGRFHYFLPPGTYQVTFSAVGYDPKTVSVDIVEGKSTLLEVQLGDGPCLTVNGIASPDNVLDLDFDWLGGAGQSFMNGISLVDTGWSFKNGVFVPIGWDFLYQITVGKYPGWYGTLNGFGHASATLPIPDHPDVDGLTVFMAYFTFENNKPTAASSAVKIFIEN